MASIFGPLDKRQRAASDAHAVDAEITYEDRADLLNDLLEEDVTTFPLVSCPPEVLSSILLLSHAVMALRMRPLCNAMRGAIDGNVGLWSLLTIRDFADMGGMTKHYKGLRTLADAWANRAVQRLEWDPVMICAPPALRYTLLATGESRRRVWNEHGHSLGAGWAWFSAKVCRRMSVSTFFRWASLQYEGADLRALLPQWMLNGSHVDADEPVEEESEVSRKGQRFRCGRSDAVELSADAVSDIFETVQKWHSKEHCEMMRKHMKGEEEGDVEGQAKAATPSSFSATPTLDAAEAAAFAACPGVTVEAAAEETNGEDQEVPVRGAASHRIEEAQLRLALEMSKAEAENAEEGASGLQRTSSKSKVAVDQASAKQLARPNLVAKPEVRGLQIRGDGRTGPALLVFLKDHCLADRVSKLPDALEKSIEHIVRKMTSTETWGLLYESLTEELSFRAKLSAWALCASHARAVDELLSMDISLEQEHMCLPIWRKSSQVMTKLSKLRTVMCDPDLRKARCDLLKLAVEEWSDLEDLTEFLDAQLAPLELAIDNFRAVHEASHGKAHTPHVRDIGRLMFRNFCLMDSRVFRSLCLAAYALVHEVHSANFQGQNGDAMLDILEGLHSMLVACDVSDDHLSTSKSTKDQYGEHLVIPITAAVERLTDLEVQRHPTRRSGR
mmetsp:Transcript_56394/g.132252  ORF Transcript_56394/g.132252 Transcript_56394/m.132252 type:complete len:672 (-) Transcript_56394:101-2116(-)